MLQQLVTSKKTAKKISSEPIVKCVTSVGPKFKTVSAVTRRVSDLESKALHRAKAAQKSDMKDQSKRSLNFHNFLTVSQTNTEVARFVLNESRKESRLSVTHSKSLVAYLESASLSTNTTDLNYFELVKAVSASISEIPPNLYPKILELIKKHGEDHYRSALLQTQLLDRVFLSESVQASISNAGGWPCLAAQIAGIRIPKRYRSLTETMLLTSWDPKMQICDVDYVLTHLAYVHDRVLYAKTESLLLERLSSRPTLPDPVLSLFHSNRSPGVPPARLLESVAALIALKKVSRQFRERLNVFLNQHFHSIPVPVLTKILTNTQPPLDCTSHVLESIIRKRLSSMSSTDIKSVADCAATVKFDNRFAMKRLANRLGVDSSYNVHNERFELLKTFYKKYLHRYSRRKLHSLLGSIRIGRVDPTLIQDAYACGAPSCATCLKFKQQIELARAFHFPRKT